MTDALREALPAGLQGIKLVTLAQNVPGPAAASRLQDFGASVIKIEQPNGDPLASANPAWYGTLVAGQKVVQLDLKDAPDHARLDEYLAEADVLLTSSRPGSLARLGFGQEELRGRYPRLCYVAIIGYPAPREDAPGHDLTHLAEWGLLSPPDMPLTLLADLGGAERAVSATLALLLERAQGRGSGYAEVALSEVAAFFAGPLRYGITKPGAPLGGGFPGYSLYEAREGWISVAVQERHFWGRLLLELDLEDATREDLEEAFMRKTAKEWEQWAKERNLPLAALRDVPQEKEETR